MRGPLLFLVKASSFQSDIGGKQTPDSDCCGSYLTQQPETKLPWPPDTMRNRQRSHVVKTHDQRAHHQIKKPICSMRPHAPRRIEHKNRIREATDTTALTNKDETIRLGLRFQIFYHRQKMPKRSSIGISASGLLNPT